MIYDFLFGFLELELKCKQAFNIIMSCDLLCNWEGDKVLSCECKQCVEMLKVASKMWCIVVHGYYCQTFCHHEE